MNVQRASAIATLLCSAAVVCMATQARAEFEPARPLEELRLASLLPAATPRQTPHPAVVRVIATDRNGLSLGSGTLVDANDDYGLIITNWHVVRDAVGPIEVVFPDGFHSPARVVRTDREWDLAALLIWKPQVLPVTLSTEAPRPGEMLTIAGYGSGVYKMQSGKCTQYLAPAPGKPLEIVELAAAARHGDSGGPILNSHGELAGVLFGEGGGRTDGSYGGRVNQFLRLAAVDLQKLPDANGANNIAKNSAPARSRRDHESIAQAGPVAQFDGGLVAPETQTNGWPGIENPSQRVAERPANISRPLAISAPPAQPGDKNYAGVSAHKPLGGLHGFWFVWGDEIKGFLAAFGVAAILLNAIRWATGK